MSGAPKTHGRARRLRRAMTPPEVLLWVRLKGSPEGISFRRQHPLGRFILDFYCAAAKLAVEVDGYGHNLGDQPERDEARDAWLAEHGVLVLRISAVEVMRDPDWTAEGIVRLAWERAGRA